MDARAKAASAAEARTAALETRAAAVADAETAGLNLESMRRAERTAQAVEEAAAGLRAAHAGPGQQEYEGLLGLVRGLRGPHPGPEIPFPPGRRLRLEHTELGEAVSECLFEVASVSSSRSAI